MSKWRRIHSHLETHGFPEAAAKKIVARYSAEMRRRFSTQGDGDWQDLSPETIRKRRKKSNRPLLDTGTLRRALTVGAAGNHYQNDRRGIEFGFGDTGKSNDGKRTIGEIARFHQYGMGNNPKREILVEPSHTTLQRMVKDVVVEVDRLGKLLGGANV